LNPTTLRPRILTLITTRQCTAACDHCCFACTPTTTERISPERLKLLIDEALEIPSIRFISFVGGECFLLGEELDARIAQASHHGFRVGVTTNGYWAVNRSAATKRVARVREAGLDVMSLSTGEMHARFVPVERIVHGAIAACESGLEVSVSIEAFLGTSFDAASITERPELRALSEAGRLTIFTRAWLPNADNIGKAELSHDSAENRFSSGVEYAGCDVILDDITVTPSLRVAACCGYPVESIPELQLGSAESRTLREILRSAPDDTLKLWLHVAGPERMLLFVKSVLPEYELPQGVVHPCQACLHLHRDPIALDVLRRNAGRYEGALRSAFEALAFRTTTADAPVALHAASLRSDP
jgi:hypothetical protein